MPAVTRAIKQKRVTEFSCEAESADSVNLAGTFNDWNPQLTPMSKSGSGDWRVNLELPAGEYEYRFVVDGRWSNEPDCANHEGCPHCIANPFGSRNQRLQVE